MVLRRMSPRMIALAVGGVLVLTAACLAAVYSLLSSPGSGGTSASGGAPAQKKADPYHAPVKITPAHGSTKARPDKGVDVKVANGALEKVTVRSKSGRSLTGSMSSDNTAWSTKWTLTPGETYTVTAIAKRRDGKATTTTSKFTTLKPAQRLGISGITPASGVVGVGMPIIVTFDRPVLNRNLVEKALEVKANRKVTGAWRWVGNQQVIFRTKKYWPVGTRVTFNAHTAGVRAAKDTYGIYDRSVRFSVGDSHITTVDVKTHKAAVRVNGRTVKTTGISAGKGDKRKYTTTNGVHLTMDKGNPVVMTSEWEGITDKKDPRYYKLKVKHAVRISNSGEYLHAAPWSVDAQGRANTSHGCINASPEFAKWFYGLAQPGDVVVVTGTDRELEPFNGWGFWQMSFGQWAQGSELDRTVSTGPSSQRSDSSSKKSSSPGNNGGRSSVDDFGGSGF